MNNYDQTTINEYNLLPVVESIYADQYTPVQVLKKLKEAGEEVFLLESADNSGQRGRYSFLGLNPSLKIRLKDGFYEKIGNEIESFQTDDPLYEIEKILSENRSPSLEDLPPFTGGFIGYISYDFYQYQEPTLSFTNKDPFGFYDLELNLYKEIIVFDHFRDKILIIVNAETKDFEKSYEKALEKIEEIRTILKTDSNTEFSSEIIESFEPLYTEDEYAKKIRKAKDYIKEGDIFQVVPSNRIKGKIRGSLLPAYRIMRSDNPSPYMYYLAFDNAEIAGASPETLVQVKEDTVLTFPIAGSRPRGKTKEEDQLLEEELLSDKKELAEHNMLVDLGRNDLGKVAVHGSVKVKDYQHIQRYSKIMHITSTVTGKLREDISALQALGAILPAGTLSGAPKIRACEIIEELEDERRGVYGGAVGYIGFNGNLDMCIAIRSAFKMNDDVYVQSGGGIVYDSIEHNEYLESINKAAAVIEAIKLGDQHDLDS